MSWPGCWQQPCHTVWVSLWAGCGLVGGSPLSVINAYSGLLGLGSLGVIMHCSALLCIPVLSAFTVFLYMYTTSACTFGEAHGMFVLVSRPSCFASMPRPLLFGHFPTHGLYCLCLVACWTLWCCAASSGPSLPCHLHRHVAVDDAVLRIYIHVFLHARFGGICVACVWFCHVLCGGDLLLACTV